MGFVNQASDHQMARLLTIGLSFHWFVFWLFNGLDKILNGQDLGLFVWSGKDRTDQFAGYLTKLGWGLEVHTFLMGLAFVVEVGIALAFLRAMIRIIRNRSYGEFYPHETLKLPILLSVLCFTAFSAWDIVVGDRAELWEHGTFLVTVCITWVIASFESLLDVVQRKAYDGPERRSSDLEDRRRRTGSTLKPT